MRRTKTEIEASLYAMRDENRAASEGLGDRVLLTDYHEHVKDNIWTEAFQKALNEHHTVVIPGKETPYFLDNTVIVPSDRRIEAEDAVITLSEGCRVLMLRNAHTMDGTHAPIPASAERDRNIAVIGGRWEMSIDHRSGYGRDCRYAPEGDTFHGVSTLFFFNNMDGLLIEDVTFAHTAGFSVQTGDIRDAAFTHIRFDTCYADGLHLNGNSENLLCEDIRGQVGDDLVALNMYDWQNSSVNFGPTRNVLCTGLELDPTSPYHALRIEPGLYRYDDGSSVDCALYDTVIRDVKGIKTFKLYFQTPRYKIGQSPEWGEVGSADNLYFEDITVDLDGPIDGFPNYLESHPVHGSIGAFEMGCNAGFVSFENIDLTLHRERYLHSYLVVCGPKSARSGEYEIFDPFLSSTVGTLRLKNIRVNGKQITNDPSIIREVTFDDINGDGHSTASGVIREIVWDD
ncbi:MAG: hypothetical protein MJ175_00980 [Clostridia bacterium]|nr:hypothetical protein [Clostridia bacterium]